MLLSSASWTVVLRLSTFATEAMGEPGSIESLLGESGPMLDGRCT